LDEQRQRVALRRELAQERAAVIELEVALRRQQAVVVSLEQQLAVDNEQPRRPESEARPRAVVPATWSASQHVLSRCEGFSVVSPSGRTIGVVAGVRFGERIDRPDLLEIDAGRLRERLIMVSVDEIEAISAEEEWIALIREPGRRRDGANDLLSRIRAHIHPTPSTH
jgi:hypothetical protein